MGKRFEKLKQSKWAWFFGLYLSAIVVVAILERSWKLIIFALLGSHHG